VAAYSSGKKTPTSAVTGVCGQGLIENDVLPRILPNLLVPLHQGIGSDDQIQSKHLQAVDMLGGLAAAFPASLDKDFALFCPIPRKPVGNTLVDALMRDGGMRLLQEPSVPGFFNPNPILFISYSFSNLSHS
jgi:hypothetical protein